MTTIYVSRGTYAGYDVILKTGGVFEADANIDLNGNDLTDVDDIDFLVSGQSLNTDTSGIHLNLPTGDIFDITINSQQEYDFDATELDMHSNDINNTGLVTFASTSTGGTTAVTISSLNGSMYFNVPSTDNFFFNVNGANIFDLDASRLDLNDHFLQMTEMTAPTGTANIAKLYAQDNGAGKTQLMVIFGSGVAQQIAIEP